MSKILITGGAGFIGSHTARALLTRGDSVTLLDDFNDQYDSRLKEARIKYMFVDVPVPQVVRGDIRDRELLKHLFAEQQFDKVIHLAAWASVQPSIQNPHLYTEVNVDGTVNMLEMCRQHTIQNLVFASSSSVYGGLKEVPFQEDADVSRPLSPYAATKAAGEILCATWHNLYGLPISCLRFFTVYGPWGRPEMAIFKFTQAIFAGQTIEMRGRETMRDFTYVDDIVQGIVHALDRPNGFAIYNLGKGDSVPLPRLVTALEVAVGQRAKVKEVPLPPGDVPQALADIRRSQRELEYNPTTSIEEGVKKFVDWYQNVYVPLLAPARTGQPQSV